MKKKLLSIFMAFCMILPFACTLTACSDDDETTTPTTPTTPTHTCTASTEWTSDDTHHWHKCTDTTCTLVLDKDEHEFTTTTVDATLDADGKTTTTCSICSKTTETTIPKLTQTKNEMIAVLANAVKEQNYAGEIQETFIYTKNVDETYSDEATVATDTDVLARKADGSMVYYSQVAKKPAGYTAEDYIYWANYVESTQTNNVYYVLNTYNDPTKTDIFSKNYVGDNYSQSFTLNKIQTNLDYLLNINSEATMESTLKATLSQYIPMYQQIFGGYFGDTFTYSEDDIVVTANVVYANGEYTASGTIVLDTLTHTGASPTRMVKDFKVEFTVIYTNDLVKQNYSKFIYHVDTDLSSDTNALKELYIINDYQYSKTAGNAPFEKIKAIIDVSAYSTPVSAAHETLYVYVNGQIYAHRSVEFNTAINTTLDQVISDLTDSCGEYSTITAYLDEDCTVPYVTTTDVIIEDYYGTSVYLTMVPNNGYSVVITNHIIFNAAYGYESTRTVSIQIVTKNGGTYDIELEGPNPAYDGGTTPGIPETVTYDDMITVNGTPQTETSITISDDYYVIDLYYHVYS